MNWLLTWAAIAAIPAMRIWWLEPGVPFWQPFAWVFLMLPMLLFILIAGILASLLMRQPIPLSRDDIWRRR